MKTESKGLLSNCVFLIRFVYRIHHAVFICKVPQIILNVVSPFIPILFIRVILNEITIGRDVRRLLLFIILFAVVSFIKDSLSTLLDFHVKSHTEIAVRKIKNYLGETVAQMPYSDIEQPQVRDFILRAQDGTNFAKVLDEVSSIITSFLTIAGLTSIIITIQPFLLAFILLTVVVRLIVDKKNRKLWEKWRPSIVRHLRRGNYVLSVMRSIGFGKEVRINSIEDWLYKKTDLATDDYLKTTKQHNTELQRNNTTSSAVGIIQEGAIYLLLAYRVLFKGLAIGDFSMYITSATAFSDSVTSIVSSVSSFLETGLFVKDFRYCIESAEASKTVTEGCCDYIDKRTVTLELKKVSFKYPNTSRYILKDVSLSINSGESLSIVGVNGAGKTTLIKLICRLYKPTKGRILLNGVNIQEYSYRDYVRHIGAVFQDFKIYGFSIRENISFCGDSEGKKINDCLRESGLSETIKSLPYGLETNLTKEFDSQGIELSGGEKQELVMARVLYKNAPILILDEPTSALDPVAEAAVFQNYHKLSKGRISIYITHRLSSCRFCDRIAVLDGGRIAQYGTHDELMAEHGLYSKLWEMQANHYGEGLHESSCC